MKRKYLAILGISLLLMGCDKTEDLYIRNAYNSSIFEENYYTDYDGLDIANFNKKDDVHAGSLTVIAPDNVGENMSSRNPEYAKGILSKLYDGRLDCGSFYQLSRVQLKREGFGTRLPEALDIDKFQMSARGGSTCETPLAKQLDFDYFLTIYTNSDYYEFAFDGNLTPVDNSRNPNPLNITRQFEASFSKTINGVIGYSLTWDCSEFSTTEGVTPDDEIALMLYEVVLE